mmetsp:Transcript_93268/g.266679  ORF Transcript_93268/g.266679 Transcript_93268/m.266679 type:complete len:419 (+) Transcript_93268:100-1356(+)
MASYDASRLVDHIHNWPRYAWGEGHLVYTTNVFGFQYDNVDAGYVKGVLSLPALLLTVAVFLIISSSIFCMCRGLACVCMCCYNACGHGKSRTKGNRRHGDTDAGQSEGLMNSAYVERNSEDPYFVPDDHSTCVRIGFGVLIVLAIASVVLATCSLIGNGDVATGVRHIDHAVTTLTGLVNNLTDISDDMSELSTKVELDLNYTMQKNVCKEFIPESEWELLEEYVGWFSTGATMLKRDLKHAPGQLSRLHDDVDKYGNAWRKTFIWGLLGAVLVAAITECVIVVCQNCRRMSCALSTIAVPLTMLMAIATALIAAVTMTSTMVVADYCVEPSANMLSVIPQPSMQYNVSRFYITCTGDNPLDDPYDEAVRGVNEATTYTLTIQEQYCDNPFLSKSQCCTKAVPLVLNDLGTPFLLAV